MKNQNYVSPYLFHFVGRTEKSDRAKFELLLKILTDQQLRHTPFEKDGSRYGYSSVLDCDGEWKGSILTEKQGPDGNKPLFDNIVCFADIPLESLMLHMSKYSQFGLSFEKGFLSERGVRPVMYFPHWKSIPGLSIHGRDAAQRLDTLLKQLFENESDGDKQLRRTVLLDLMAFIKPFDVSKSEDDIDNYYMEREWRSVGYVSFSLTNVQQVLVPSPYQSELLQRFPALSDRIVDP
ncbi:abortive infection system antitoxin AbiGi family protein [uncultured Roseobacter sp.]|uniref:abortive infection system antitoxin AbiGi family protein n=1 Tax=uncultured Roseobacter sp. TaxID=114847 RepID=UPI0026162429|nr:abortive infection system antitoxin AbiGi family protein [uncultured Roseobacter sp.]